MDMLRVLGLVRATGDTDLRDVSCAMGHCSPPRMCCTHAEPCAAQLWLNETKADRAKNGCVTG